MPLKENSATERKETNTLKERKLESQPASLWKRNVLETRPPLYYTMMMFYINTHTTAPRSKFSSRFSG